MPGLNVCDVFSLCSVWWKKRGAPNGPKPPAAGPCSVWVTTRASVRDSNRVPASQSPTTWVSEEASGTRGPIPDPRKHSRIDEGWLFIWKRNSNWSRSFSFFFCFFGNFFWIFFCHSYTRWSKPDISHLGQQSAKFEALVTICVLTSEDTVPPA